MMLSHTDLKLYTANIGDSGFLVVRQGEVVHRSQEQQHYFNTPFQLSLPPTELQSEVLSDQPESADQYEFPVQDGDVILLATDGIFDNVPDQLLIEEMDKVQNCKDIEKIQQCANGIALMARKLSRDPKFLSPFSVNALANGIVADGGKPDDITLLLATVAL
jgi:protein phosphatase PTC7